MAIKGAKGILALRNKRVRDSEGRFLVEGVRLCEEALSSPVKVQQVLIAREELKSERIRRLVEQCRTRDVPVQETNGRALKAFCEAVTPQGVVAVVSRRPWGEERIGEGPAIVLDRIRDPGNVGMILRTAEAAGATAVFLSTGSVELHNPKTVRASMGAIFRLPAFERVELKDVLQGMREKGFQIVGADVRAGMPYCDFRPSAKFALLLGGEASGLDGHLREAVDQVVHIPMRRTVESLNVAVAAGILLYGMKAGRGDPRPDNAGSGEAG